MINYESRTYFLNIIHGEHINETYERLWKIIQHNPWDDVMYDKLVRISKMWYYKNRLKCQYTDAIENLIKSF